MNNIRVTITQQPTLARPAQASLFEINQLVGRTGVPNSGECRKPGSVHASHHRLCVQGFIIQATTWDLGCGLGRREREREQGREE
ncbi:hypothetical protein E2C01_094559 [Portunus trituberculatus]|uniref:Uncharacterized protein n=1 Tax=Portunus trituberculatus TaxID=210409 RepID=A0A5B7JSQ0_PORTR|nr:hypothetical protein [Portunus trituberculatus]